MPEYQPHILRKMVSGGRGQGGEMAQTIYIHMNKFINNFKK
jgi:hypothetical protein